MTEKIQIREHTWHCIYRCIVLLKLTTDMKHSAASYIHLYSPFMVKNENEMKTSLCSKSTNLCRRLTSTNKVIRDSNPDFRIKLNPYSDPDVCRIAPKMLCIYQLSVSVVSPCRENRPATLREMLINLLRSPIPQWWGKWKSDPESVSGTGTGSPPITN